MIDFAAKPDLVAPGTGTVSLSDKNSLFYTTKSSFLVASNLTGLVGSLLGYKPYLTLSGTSMSTPVVAGTVALMLEANPKLTPNLVKAILQFTAQVYPGYNALTQGAGFVNARGAVDLARFFADPTANAYPLASDWSEPMQHLATQAWGLTWARPGLPHKTRSMLNLAFLVALDKPEELELHTTAALRNGVTPEEIMEVLIQAAIYCGFPAALKGTRTARQAIEHWQSGEGARTQAKKRAKAKR